MFSHYSTLESNVSQELFYCSVLFGEATFFFRHVLNATSKYSDNLPMNPENK